MTYRALLLDFDGTLVHSLPLWQRAFKKTLGGFGVDIADDQIVKRCFYRPWADVAAEFDAGPAETFERRLLDGLAEAFLDATIFPAVPAFLEEFRSHGFAIALVTAGPTRVVREALPRLGLDGAFDFVITGDEVTHHKPHPEALLRALEALEVSPGEAVMVGDSRADILGGKAAGTTTALFLPDVHLDFYCFDTLRATDPDIVFTDHAELSRRLALAAAPLRAPVAANY